MRRIVPRAHRKAEARARRRYLEASRVGSISHPLTPRQLAAIKRQLAEATPIYVDPPTTEEDGACPHGRGRSMTDHPPPEVGSHWCDRRTGTIVTVIDVDVRYVHAADTEGRKRRKLACDWRRTYEPLVEGPDGTLWSEGETP